MLPFQKDIFSELYEDDGLCVMASGLGLNDILYQFIRLYSNDSSLVFILNLPKKEENYIQQRLLSDHGITDTKNKNNINKRFPRMQLIDSSLAPNKRQSMYLSGGCFPITSRILVVDMLSNYIPFKSITGILINKAHKFVCLNIIISLFNI